MSATPLIFEFPGLLDCEQFLSALSARLALSVGAQESMSKTFYDSFDWRLFKAGMTLEFDKTPRGQTLNLMNLKHPQTLMTMDIEGMPKFAEEFFRADFRKQLSGVLEMRALLPVAKVDFNRTQINILNTDQKTILRLNVDQFAALPARISVIIIKGYDKKVLAVLAILQAEFSLHRPMQPLLVDALKLYGRVPGDNSSKLKIQLDPYMRADIASKYIFSHLLNTLKQNIHGCIENIDSEFLHDFRVAVRRTRTGLSQVKQVLPKDRLAYFAEFFAWLGQITGNVRDIDVSLLNFENYQKSLPDSCREDLAPLRPFLQDKQRLAYQTLAEQLNSSRFKESLAEWAIFLKTPVVKFPVEVSATQAIKEFADFRLWKLYKQLIKEAKALKRDSSPAELHGMRKTAKKYRYLLEFFLTLYPESSIKLLLKSLKTIQVLLGHFQDYEVQQLALKRYSLEMRTMPVPIETLLAIELLIQDMEQKKANLHLALTLSFEMFTHKKQQQAVKALFVPESKLKRQVSKPI